MEYTYNEYADDVLNNKINACEAIKLACKRYKDWFEREDIYFDKDDVERKIRIVSKLKHTTGKHNGKPFILLPWQQFCVANIFGWKYKKNDLRVTRNVFLMLSRKSGKALSLDTKLYTPTGVTTMGEIKEGDVIIGADGKETTVTYTTPIKYNHNCYKVTFEDGEKIIADAEHNWYVYHNQKCCVKTTEEILPKYKRIRKDGKGIDYLYRVPMNKPIDYSEKSYTIDPYVLGLWLGDGDSAKPNFTVDIKDLPMYDYLTPIYGSPKIYVDKRNTNTLDISYADEKGKNNSLLRHQLTDLGVFKNKHIPTEYLYGSIEQRLALLQGLMDTDGSISKEGECEFIQKKTDITDGLCTLLSSLGIKYKRKTKTPKINGKECAPVQVVRFFTDKTLPCFRLQRKFDRLKDKLNKRMLYKTIIDIEKVDSVPVRCITVDNAEHLYLCGERCTVTHNTAFASALGMLCAIADKESNAEVELVANSRQQAKIAFDITSNFCESVDKRNKIFKRYRDTIKIPQTKSKIQILSSDAMGNDGYNSSCFVLDEFHAAKNWDLYNVMKSSQGMRQQPLAIIITTAGFLLNGYPCYEHRNTCIDILKGNKTDDSQFSAIYELDEGDDWECEDNWVKCTPSIGQTVGYDYLREQVQAAKNNAALEVGVRTKNFNQFCQTKDVWIPNNYLSNTFAKVDFNDFKDEDCYMGVDLSAISDLTATSVMFPPNEDRKVFPDKYVFKNIIYVPETAIEESVNGDLYKLWKRQKYVDITSGNVVDYDYILKDQLKVYNDTYLLGIYYDEWNALSWAIDATTEGLPLYPYSQAIGNFNRPTKAFEMLIRQGKVVIDYNPCVRWCFNNVELKYDYNDNCKPVKSGGVQDRKIDPIIAMIQALGGYLNKNMKGITDGEVLSV